MMTSFVNDGTVEMPKLQVYLNLDTLVGLRSDSAWPGFQGPACFQRLASDKFQGVQLTTDDPPIAGLPFPHCGIGRVNVPADADIIAARSALRGDNCLTVHAGWGMEDEDEVDRLVEAILRASEKHRLPIFIETHRATITQDIWRTVQITKRFPEVRFNGDFSHYYCGQELVYGDWRTKLAFMNPIFERIGFMHGRIASPGCMQVSIETSVTAKQVQIHGEADFVEHFKELWTKAMLGFARTAGPGDILIFAPELLSGRHYYARCFPDSFGKVVEESDRYAQALYYCDLARACFAEAKRQAAMMTQQM